mgnify:FL=1|tara:strand:+ start:400 stop:921 length:522 start_codon:yes stop_codon:yes gene_type:complete
MGGFSSRSSNSSGGNKNKTKFGYSKPKSTISKIGDYIKTGGMTGAIVRGVIGKVKSYNKKQEQNKMDYEGQAAGVTPMGRPSINTKDDDKFIRPKGIEFAKASTTSATILGPAEIQKEAANNVKGPTTTEMSAPLTIDQISLANKRKGRRSTNITAKKTLAKNYTLSKKTLLG